MSKSTTKKASPNKLTKTGKKAGVGLTEKDLEKVSGGQRNITIKISG